MGADAAVRLPGAGLPGVWDSLPFIEAQKTGNLHRVGRRVIVIGGRRASSSSSGSTAPSSRTGS
jgi:NADPH-dependent glutamate synthase beta subunit-like oxidoreductase